MSDLRQRLERESERVTLASGAEGRMFERARRRERTRRTTALVLGIVLFAIVLAVVGSSLPGGDRRPEPATPTSTSPADVAGTYRVLLPVGDADIERLGMNGSYTLVLRADGTMSLSGPRRFDLPGAAIAFDVERGLLTTDVFVGASDAPWLSNAGDLSAGCDTPGVYRVTLDAGSLALEAIDDTCELRAALLATRAWTVAAGATRTDPLEGEWISTFSCERMVRAVERAPVSRAARAFWTQGVGAETGSDDPSDPCRGVSEPLSQTFRFDDGRLLIFDQELREGFDGAYEVHGASFELRDATRDNNDGSYWFRFRIQGDVMTIDIVGRGGRDPFFVGTGESAPLIRSSG